MRHLYRDMLINHACVIRKTAAILVKKFHSVHRGLRNGTPGGQKERLAQLRHDIHSSSLNHYSFEWELRSLAAQLSMLLHRISGYTVSSAQFCLEFGEITNISGITRTPTISCFRMGFWISEILHTRFRQGRRKFSNYITYKYLKK